jgi:hypothetical protein
MTLVLLDSMDDAMAWDTFSVITPVTGRNGTGGALGVTANCNFRLPQAQESDYVTMGFAIYCGAYNTVSSVLCSLNSDDNATTHLTVQITSSGKLFVQRGVSNLGPFVPFAVRPNAWTYVEVQARLHSTLGFVLVQINGVNVLNVTGVNTKNGGTKTTFDTLVLCNPLFTGGGPTYDDVYIMTGTGDSFLGDINIERLLPNADGAVNGFLGSDGDSVQNFLLVDEAPPNKTDYVGASAVSTEDLYGLTDLVHTTGTVVGVTHQAIARKSDSGYREIKIVNRRTGDFTSVALPLTTMWDAYHYTLANDPETGVPFTIANVNSLQSGVVVTG